MVQIDFNELYKQHSKRLCHIAFQITKDKYLAEDVVQETFIKAFKKADSIENADKIGSWLSAIAARTAIDCLRTEKRKNWLPTDQSLMEQVFSNEGQNQCVENEVEMILFKEEIQLLLVKLTVEYQEVLILKVRFGLKEEEIASRLNLKSGTVKTRLHRARRQLKKVMTEKFPA